MIIWKGIHSILPLSKLWNSRQIDDELALDSEGLLFAKYFHPKETPFSFVGKLSLFFHYQNIILFH